VGLGTALNPPQSSRDKHSGLGYGCRALQRRANQSREEDDNSDKEEPSGKRGSKSPPKRSDKAPKSSVQSITRALVKAKGESSKISCASQAAQTAVQA